MGYLTSVAEEDDVLVKRLAESLLARGWRLAVAESLTCGRVVSVLGEGADAAEWLAGGIVAYAPEVKFDVLGVEPGPVINPACARQLASGVVDLLHADVGVGLTGCGGPDPEEGWPPGTVFIAAAVADEIVDRAFAFDGPPEHVLSMATTHALQLLVEILADDETE